MGTLVAAGFSFVIVMVLGLVISLIGLFAGHIIIFDSIALAVIGGAVAHNLCDVGTVLSIVIGVGIFALLMFLQSTGPGFWIIGGLLSLVWGFIFSLFAFSLSGENMVITIAVWMIGTAFMVFQHLRSRRKIEKT